MFVYKRTKTGHPFANVLLLYVQTILQCFEDKGVYLCHRYFL